MFGTRARGLQPWSRPRKSRDGVQGFHRTKLNTTSPSGRQGGWWGQKPRKKTSKRYVFQWENAAYLDREVDVSAASIAHDLDAVGKTAQRSVGPAVVGFSRPKITRGRAAQRGECPEALDIVCKRIHSTLSGSFRSRWCSRVLRRMRGINANEVQLAFLCHAHD